MDASNYQVGACIMQRVKVVACCSHKLTKTQQNCSTMEKELLSVVLTLSEFRTMVLGTELHVCTDHKNLTYSTLNSLRVLRWHLFLEERGAKCHYIQVSKDLLVDAFLRLPCMDPPSLEEKESRSSAVSEDSLFIDECLLDCFVNFPSTESSDPLDLGLIQQE